MTTDTSQHSPRTSIPTARPRVLRCGPRRDILREREEKKRGGSEPHKRSSLLARRFFQEFNQCVAISGQVELLAAPAACLHSVYAAGPISKSIKNVLRRPDDVQVFERRRKVITWKGRHSAAGDAVERWACAICLRAVQGVARDARRKILSASIVTRQQGDSLAAQARRLLSVRRILTFQRRTMRSAAACEQGGVVRQEIRRPDRQSWADQAAPCGRVHVTIDDVYRSANAGSGHPFVVRAERKRNDRHARACDLAGSLARRRRGSRHCRWRRRSRFRRHRQRQPG